MWKTASYSQMNGGCVAVWAKASRSFANGDCVEWASPAASGPQGNCVQRTARTRCNNSACVELCVCGTENCGLVHVRDSKDPDGVILDYPEGTWAGGAAVVFLPVSRSVVACSENGKRALQVAADRGHDPDAHWYMVTPGLGLDQALWFDQAEVDAWRAGVTDGEFALTSA